MSVRQLEVVLRANVGGYVSQLGVATGATRDFGRETTKVARLASSSRDFEKLGRSALIVGGAFSAAAALSVKAAINWESAWAGVTKTVDGTTEQMAQLEGELRGLARTLPATHGEIAGVAEAAGQLGIQRGAITDFTRTMVDLAETTNLTADQAATSMARIANIMQTPQGEIDRMGATLVALGNAGASTEAEIVEMATRIASAGRQVGLSESDVLAFANALSSVGIEAEAGGSAISRVMIEVQNAVMDGSGALDVFALTAGQTTDEFARGFRDNASSAIIAFIEGLRTLGDQGVNTNQILKDLKLDDLRVGNALRSAAGAGDLFRESIELGSAAWEENTALTEEAEKRYATTASQLKVLRNNATDLAITFGDGLLPAVKGTADRVTDLLVGFREMDGSMQTVATIGGSLVGTVALLGGGFLLLAPRVGEALKQFQALEAAAPRLAGALKLGVGAAAGAGAALVLVAQQIGESKQRADELISTLTKDVDTSNVESIHDALADVRAELEVQQGRWDGMGTTAEKALVNAIQWITPLNDTISDTVEALGALEAAEGDLLRQAVHMDENLLTLRNEFGLTEQDVVDLAKATGVDLTGSFNDVVPVLREAYAAVLDGRPATDALADSTSQLAMSMEENEEAAKALHERLTDLGEAYGSFTVPLGAWDAVIEKNRALAESTAAATDDAGDSWADFYDGVTVSTADWIAEMQRQVDAQQEWADNLAHITLNGRGDVADILAAMGPEGADLAARFADLTGAEFQRAADLLVQSTRDGTEEAGGVMDTNLKILKAIAASGGKATVQSLVTELEVGVEQIRAVTGRYGIVLAEGINPVLLGIGKQAIAAGARALGFATGGPVPGSGDGDTVPAMLTPGEFVIRKAAVKAVGVDRLHRLNRADRIGVQHFADGGQVQGFRNPEDVPRPPDVARYGTMLGSAAAAVMDHAFGAVVEFVKANAAPLMGSGVGVQAMMAALHTKFPGLPLISGLRPGSITRSGNLSWHARGRAVDIPPRLDVNHWIADNYGPKTLELILTAPGAVNLHHGRPHTYSPGIQADHRDHNHWAMAKGGTGVVTRPTTFLAGEAGPEAFSFVPLHMATGGLVGRSVGDIRFGNAVVGAGARAAAAAGYGRGLKPDEGLPLLREMGEAYAEVAFAVDEATARMLLSLGLTVDEFQATARQVVDLNGEMEQAAEERARREAERAAEMSRNARDLWFAGSPIEQQVQMLDEWIAAETAYTDEWRRLVEQRNQITADYQRDRQRATEDERDRLRQALDDLESEWRDHVDRLADVFDRARDGFRQQRESMVDDLAGMWSNAQQAATRQQDDFARVMAERNKRIAEEIGRFRDSIAGPVREIGDLIGTFGGRAQTVTGDEVTAMLTHRVEAARRWDETLRRLASSGLQADLVTRLAQQGPQALGLAQGLLGVDADTVNGMLAELDRLGGGLGDLFATREQAAITARVNAEMPLPAMRTFNDLLAEEQRLWQQSQMLRMEAERWARSMVDTLGPQLNPQWRTFDDLLAEEQQVMADAQVDRLEMEEWATRMAADAMPALVAEIDRYRAALDAIPRQVTTTVTTQYETIAGHGPGLQPGTGLKVPVGVYDQGGWLPRGWSLAGNFTGAPERVGKAVTINVADGAVQVSVGAGGGVTAGDVRDMVYGAFDQLGRRLEHEVAG